MTRNDPGALRHRGAPRHVLRRETKARPAPEAWLPRRARQDRFRPWFETLAAFLLTLACLAASAILLLWIADAW